MAKDLSLDEWVTQLLALNSDAADLTLESVRRQLLESGFDLAEWEGPRARPDYKSVLHAIAPIQANWLYATDWKGPRDGAAQAFERLLGLPAETLVPLSSEPIVLVADAANEEAGERGITTDQLEYLPPYDDACVFARVDPGDHELRVFLGLDDPQPPVEEALELADDDALDGIRAFSVHALNTFQNMGVRTVGELCQKSAADLRRYSRDTSVIDHTQQVLRRAGRSLS